MRRGWPGHGAAGPGHGADCRCGADQPPGQRRIVENFLISGGYNVVAVPLALVGSATPLAAALAMSLSSITVSLNALRLK
jgi:hypothetical protein